VPKLVAEVEFTTWTRDALSGIHPSKGCARTSRRSQSLSRSRQPGIDKDNVSEAGHEARQAHPSICRTCMGSSPDLLLWSLGRRQSLATGNRSAKFSDNTKGPSVLPVA
jgi:hypothetical protein